MKNIFSIMAIAAVVLSACNSGSSKNENKIAASASDSAISQTQTTAPQTLKAASVNDIVSAYLDLKNALAADNANDAAMGGNAIVSAVSGIDTASFTAAQSKIYSDVIDDIKEHGEHIGANAKDIAHQREHFDMLSKDMYDLAKGFIGSQTLYKDYCPMYNDGKGGIWLSETKEIKNPYLGKKMPSCGSMKEEIK